MEILLSGTEILAQMRSLMGQQTSEAVSGISTNQYKAFRQAATLKLFADSKWLASEVRTTVDVGTGQYQIAYPTNMACGSIRELAICDPDDGAGGVYSPLELRDLPAALDFDQIEALGGDAFEAIQGTPAFAQQRTDYIYLYPPNDDTPRKLRIRGNVRLTWTNESDLSVCDAQAIIYWAVSMAYGASGDPGQQAYYQGLYADRVSQLRGHQCTGEVVTFRGDAPTWDGIDILRPIPNWDTSPRV
jgi:hypothetical protein